jgi:hypothetical protein
MYRFECGDDEIVATIWRELEIEAGNTMEVDESDEGIEKELTTSKQVMELCQQLETLCIKHGSFDNSLGLAKQLWQYRIHLNREQGRLCLSDVTVSQRSHNMVVNNSHNALENTLPRRYTL